MVKIVIEFGFFGYEICKVVKVEGVIFIVLGSCGVGIVCCIILGSVSDYVIYYVYILVVVVLKV